MSFPEENIVQDWYEHDAHADDGFEPSEPDDYDDPGFVYVYDPEVPRTVLSEDMYHQVLDRAREGASITGGMDALTYETVVEYTLTAVGFLRPPPEPDPDNPSCEAMWPNEEGWWLQCEHAPGHDGGVHLRGDTTWTDQSANAIPAPVYSNEPPF